MLDSSPIKKIPLIQFIAQCEQTVTDLLRRYAEGNTQFSTQFIVQKIISASGKQIKNLRKNKSGDPAKLLLPVRWIADQKFEEHLNELIKPLNLDNLNFIEATHLGIILNEYLLSWYRSIERRASGAEAKKLIGQFIILKATYLTQLKKEYVRLNKES